ncbi:hypothetical protein QJS66_12265 [Kocuria rhizophila]|nr:hypothetical protein QJS66_12265 [Kocuria rhizophila]
MGETHGWRWPRAPAAHQAARSPRSCCAAAAGGFRLLSRSARRVRNLPWGTRVAEGRSAGPGEAEVVEGDHRGSGRRTRPAGTWTSRGTCCTPWGLDNFVREEVEMARPSAPPRTTPTCSAACTWAGCARTTSPWTSSPTTCAPAWRWAGRS